MKSIFVIFFLLIPSLLHANSIGDVIMHEGSGVIERKANGEEVTTQPELDVFSFDNVKTGNGKTAIEFLKSISLDDSFIDPYKNLFKLNLS